MQQGTPRQAKHRLMRISMHGQTGSRITCPPSSCNMLPRPMRRFKKRSDKPKLRLGSSSRRFRRLHSSLFLLRLQATLRSCRRAQVEHQVTSLHKRVDAQETNLQQVIQNIFNAQTQRIEELLPGPVPAHFGVAEQVRQSRFQSGRFACSGSRAACWGSPRLWGFSALDHLGTVVAMAAERFGEASHPGPEAAQSGSFLLGSMNPTGLNGKAALCGMLPPGIIGVSETHLSLGFCSFDSAFSWPMHHTGFWPGLLSRYVPIAPLPGDIPGWEASFPPSHNVLCLMVGISTFGNQPVCRWHRSMFNLLGPRCCHLWLCRLPLTPIAQQCYLMQLSSESCIRAVAPDLFWDTSTFFLTPFPNARELQAQGFMEIQALAAARFGWIPKAT